MKSLVPVDRFDRRTLLAALAGGTLALAGCGSDEASPTGASTPGRSGSIADNHGHVALIRGPQLAAAQALNLDIRGTADHSHELDLSDAEVRGVRDGSRVAKASTVSQGHSHVVTFN